MKWIGIISFSIVVIGVGIVLILFSSKQILTGSTDSNPNQTLVYDGTIGVGEDKLEPGIRSLKQNYQNLSDVSLYWYNLDENNTITIDDSISEEIEQDTIVFTKAHGKKVYFGISDHGENEKADEILTDDTKQKAHIATVLSILETKGYDGVIIDYEDLNNEQAEDFTRYIRLLAQEVHAKGKLLSISVPVETEGNIWHGIAVSDIATIVDRMYMVTYEEYSEYTGPGPVASVTWVEQIITNAINQGVTPNKFVLGISFSANYWQVNQEENFLRHTTSKEALAFTEEQGSTIAWDDQKKSSYFTYTDQDNQNNTVVVWLEETNAVKEKIALAKKYKLKGMFFWHLGAEDQQLWQSFNTQE